LYHRDDPPASQGYGLGADRGMIATAIGMVEVTPPEGGRVLGKGTSITTTPDGTELTGLRILVVEDTLLIADMIVEELEVVGCEAVGPASRVESGLALAVAERLDGALLDVNLNGEMCFPIADALAQRGVPMAFLTGYGEATLPPAFQHLPRLAKPFRVDELTSLVRSQFARRRSEAGPAEA
jgi:CheY-like chemotaxis protein